MQSSKMPSYFGFGSSKACKMNMASDVSQAKGVHSPGIFGLPCQKFREI